MIVPVEASIKNGFALPPIEEFEKLINEKTKGILICNPPPGIKEAFVVWGLAREITHHKVASL